MLRAERASNCDGRVYTITITCKDGKGEYVNDFSEGDGAARPKLRRPKPGRPKEPCARLIAVHLSPDTAGEARWLDSAVADFLPQQDRRVSKDKPGWRNGRRRGLKILGPKRPCGFKSRPRHYFDWTDQTCLVVLPYTKR